MKLFGWIASGVGALAAAGGGFFLWKKYGPVQTDTAGITGKVRYVTAPGLIARNDKNIYAPSPDDIVFPFGLKVIVELEEPEPTPGAPMGWAMISSDNYPDVQGVIAYVSRQYLSPKKPVRPDNTYTEGVTAKSSA